MWDEKKVVIITAYKVWGKQNMNDRYLEITYQKGKVVAAYFYLPWRPREKVKKTIKAAEGILVDYSKDGRPIGIEITAPQQISRQDINQVITQLNLPPFADEELAPLLAAWFFTDTLLSYRGNLDQCWFSTNRGQKNSEWGATWNCCLDLQNLPMHHKDPFDRMLIAQTNSENFTLVSNDPIFKKAVAEGKIHPLPKDIPIEQAREALSSTEGSLAAEVIKEREAGW